MKKNENTLFLFFLTGILFIDIHSITNPDLNPISIKPVIQEAVVSLENLNEHILKKIFESIPNLFNLSCISKNNFILSTNIFRDRIAAARTYARILSIYHAILRNMVCYILNDANLSIDKAFFDKNIRALIFDSNRNIHPSVLQTAADLIFATARAVLHSIPNIYKNIRLIAFDSPMYLALFNAARNSGIDFIDSFINNSEYNSVINNFNAIIKDVSDVPLEAFYTSIIARNAVLDIASSVKYVTSMILPVSREDSYAIVNNVIRGNPVVDNIISAVLRGNTTDAFAAIDNFVLQNLDL